MYTFKFSCPYSCIPNIVKCGGIVEVKNSEQNNKNVGLDFKDFSEG